MSEDLCVHCKDPVTDTDEGIGCDRCDEWTHRTCNTGITLEQYTTAVNTGQDIPFVCERCESQPVDGVTFHIQTSLTDSVDTTTATTPDDSALDDNDSAMDVNESINAPLIQSFNVAVNRSIHATPEPVEDPLPPEELSTSLDENTGPVTYELFPEGSKRRQPLLVSSDGFRYSVRKARSSNSQVQYICSSRSKKISCYATVVQKGSEFIRGPKAHTHAPQVSLSDKVSVSVKAKRVALENPYQSACEIGKKVRDSVIQADRPQLPLATSIARVANRHRASERPTAPSDLDFDVDKDFLKCEDFLVADIKTPSAGHLVFSTVQQLELLGQCKRWFLDGTFKVVGKPFEDNGQLSSIHGFIKVGDKEKQVPLAFLLMSRRRTEDYVKVLTSLRQSLTTCVVESFVIDFEQAAWLAVRRVFHGVSIQGCVFHFVQAVWRKIVDLKLKTAYSKKATIYKYLRLFMGLPFLPANHIEPAFRELASRANSPKINALIAYMDNQWLNHPIFDVESWSIYGFTVRTNNDVEGWHLVPSLRAEAESIAFELRHLRDGQSTRRIRRSVKTVNEKIQALWSQYRNSEIGTSQLLEGCAEAYGPQCEGARTYTAPAVAQVTQVTRL